MNLSAALERHGLPAARRASNGHGPVDGPVRAAIRALIEAKAIVPVDHLEQVGGWCELHGVFDDETEHDLSGECQVVTLPVHIRRGDEDEAA